MFGVQADWALCSIQSCLRGAFGPVSLFCLPRSRGAVNRIRCQYQTACLNEQIARTHQPRFLAHARRTGWSGSCLSTFSIAVNRVFSPRGAPSGCGQLRAAPIACNVDRGAKLRCVDRLQRVAVGFCFHQRLFSHGFVCLARTDQPVVGRRHSGVRRIVNRNYAAVY